MKPAISSRLVLVVRLLPIAACVLHGCNRIDIEKNEEVQASIETSERDDLQREEQELEFLKSLGYVLDDENADPSFTGVTRIESDRISPGFGLYTDDRQTARLIDHAGSVVHEWKAPPESGGCEFAQLLPNDLLALVCLNRSVTFLDWNSRVVAKTLAHVHHDAEPIGDSSVLVPIHEEYDYRGRRVVFDAILKVSADAPPQRIWGTWEAREALQELHPKLPMDAPYAPEPLDVDVWLRQAKAYDYYHLNAIQVLPDTPLGRSDRRFRAGNLLISMRNVSLVAILDQEDHAIVWSWGPGELDLQHHPRMLPSGHITIYDNGTRRGWSRIVELDPSRDRIVWEYKSPDFFSAWRGSAQRMPNGNTLICQSDNGRVFEVDREGKVVWEFWNPEIEAGNRRRLINRFTKLPEERVARILAAHRTDSKTPPASPE